VTETLPIPSAEKQGTRKKLGGRLPFLDWTRGVAATIMLQGHVFHSFARTDLHESAPWIISQFVGGITPAIFLFLTGVTLAFGVDGRERKGASRGERFHTALRRAGYLAILAYAFRIQLWLFGYPNSPVQDLLKVDILNCMALGIALIAWMSVLTTPQRVHAGVISGVLIAAASPLVSLIPAGSVPQLLRMYLVPDGNYFSFFPWASFIAFGVGAGSILRLVTEDQMHRVMQWASIIGFGLIISGQYFSNLPYSVYPSVDFWINSPGLIFIKLGVILVLLALAFLWTHHGAGRGWSWIRLLGTTSLPVYWVHIELVYGRWFGFWKEQMTIGQCAAMAVFITVLMIGLAWALKQNWQWPSLRLGSIYPAAEPRRVSGD